MGFQLWCLLALAASAAAQEPIQLEEWLSGMYAQRGWNGTWISDYEFTFTRAGEPGILVFNMNTMEYSTYVSSELLEFLNTNNPILSADRQYILAPSEVQSVYRYSTTARYALYEVATGNVNYIAGHERLQLCIFGGGHSLAYVLDNNVYYLPEGATDAIQITFDGVPDVVYNGHTDWVYEEDVMYTGQAIWFSTDGNYLAFASFDDTQIESYSYYYYFDAEGNELLYPELVDLKYPKVGYPNPPVELRVVNLATLNAAAPTWTVLQAPESVSADHVLGGVTWPTGTEIAAHWLNRRQNYSVLRICSVVTGACEEEIREQPDGWVPAALPRFSAAGDFFVSLRWSLDQADGRSWQHLHLSMRLAGQIVTTSITPGDFTVDTFVGMDETNVNYYYTRTLVNQPWTRHVYVAGSRQACLSCNLNLPAGGPCTWASATLSAQGSYMSITCSSPNEPAATFLVNPITGTILGTYVDNEPVRDNLVNKLLPQSIITSIDLEDGSPASVRLLLPPGLDTTDTTTKYPMVYYVYSGPNTNLVFNTFTVGYHSYMTTNRNVVYLMADGRGAGLKGRDNLYKLNNALGTVEIEDHIDILKKVLAQYQFIDESRVGIWGHSYGGYATLLTLEHDDDNLFRCGISGAPVTSWLYYNTMYTERYMGLPTPEDNLAGYQAGDVTLLAEKLRGKTFFIMHGNADDNVHFQNAAKLYTALQKLDIPFEQMSYPDEAHSLAGVYLHQYRTMDRFWDRCLDLPATDN